MRTTVEITEDQRAALTALAGRRGMRGFSALVREAIDRYLEEQGDDELAEVLALEGSLTEEEAEEMRRRIAAAWRTWQIPS